MKTNEFVEKVKNMGFNVNNYEVAIIIFSEEGSKVAQVSKKIERSMTTRSISFINLSKKEREDLFNLLVEYASTPLEERKEEKRYYIKMKYLDDNLNYLNYNTYKEFWHFSNQWKVTDCKVHFTLAELPDWVHEMLEQGHLVKEEVE